MGFLKRTAQGKEPDEESLDSEALEELYQRLYMKIGRDFVMRGDFITVIYRLLEALGSNEKQFVSPEQATEALSLAQEYKELLSKGISGNKDHFDLIKLEEE